MVVSELRVNLPQILAVSIKNIILIGEWSGCLEIESLTELFSPSFRNDPWFPDRSYSRTTRENKWRH